jgi:ferrous iron transport protein B
VAKPDRVKRVALAGNPNTGKTTLFNRLTGSDAKVGNYPGVTVEHQEGSLRLPRSGRTLLVDVPGTYSLSARSAEEQIAIQAIAGLSPIERSDAVLVVVDATQLTRNLYLVLQVIETDLPVLVAINMIDMVEPRGLSIDTAALARVLGVPVVAISSQSGQGIDELRSALDLVLGDPDRGRPGPRWLPTSPELARDVEAVAAAVPEAWHCGEDARRHALALWALLSIDEHDELRGASPELRRTVAARRELARASNRDIEAEIIQGRYAWIDEHAPAFLSERPPTGTSPTDRVDRFLLNPALGFLVFLAAMGLVFQSLFSGADPAIRAIEVAFGWVQEVASALLPAGIVSEFVCNALIEGVGSVLVFLPQIALLFLFIGIMEDSGYMARVAVLMDRLMKVIGLHGRAFVPMLSGYACAVPAIMATRTMERRRDRMLTMMVIPLMTCSARLPVYTLIIAALFPPSHVFGVVPVQGLLMVAMYLFSTVTALVCAAVLGRTLFKGPRVPLLVELPPYRMPHWPSVARMVWQRSKLFLTQAGGAILAITCIMWALLTFPRDASIEARFDAERAALAAVEDPARRGEHAAALDSAQAGEELRASFGGKLGQAIEPAIEPLGFDWKIGVGLLGAFAAREVFVSTLGVVYGIGADATEESPSLREKLRSEVRPDGRAVYTPLVGLSLMVFFALACQCMSTLATVRRETHSWGWPAFLFVYTGVLAWLASFAVYQGGRALGFA